MLKYGFKEDQLMLIGIDQCFQSNWWLMDDEGMQILCFRDRDQKFNNTYLPSKAAWSVQMKDLSYPFLQEVQEGIHFPLPCRRS